MKDTPISRRDFLKNMGIAGAGAFLAASPWLSAFSEVTNTSSEKCEGGYCSVVRYLSAFD